jgi:leader peptidase (prepilin peptidase) / N-methyltransferase
MFIIPFIIFLCWGSFLNVCAYRFIMGGTLWRRSRCPHCKQHLAWYDLVPVISWFALRGTCRYCQQPISALYPFIELFTAISCTALLYRVDAHYFPAYFLFATALIITIRTDLEFMLIPRVCSIYLVPIGVALSFFDLLPISWHESALGALIGYATLATIAYLYKKRTGITGMGEGDPELLAGIGAFTGITGVWYTLLIGSLTATAYAVTLIFFKKASSETKIPFGPFLAFGIFLTLLCIS